MHLPQSRYVSNCVLDAHHRFIAEECDWGFTRFSELRKLFSVQDGHTHPTIEDETAEVSVFVRVLEDPTGVLWHNFVKSVTLRHFAQLFLIHSRVIATTRKRRLAT